MRKLSILTVSMIVIVSWSPFQSLHAQKENAKISEIILRQDSLFWKAYNSCDTTQFRRFFITDVEFYHDKGGMTLGLEKLMAITKKNLCSANDFRLRREAVPGSVKVFPMENADVPYGAIISGEHVFYIRQGGKETLDGLARFTHLWLLIDGVWKMTRVLSYDHGPAPTTINRTQVAVSNEILDRYVGKYKGPQTGNVNVILEDGQLKLLVNQQAFLLYPEADNRFFTKDRDLVFEFVNAGNKGSRMLVRENGKVVEEAVFVSR